VRLAALVFLIIGNLLAGQAHAEDVAGQPLTKADCDKAGLWWNDNGNVCGSRTADAQTVPKPNAVEVLSQPLTRSGCDEAGMTWNDNANVCARESEAEVAPKVVSPAAPTVVINIDKTNQKMTISVDGVYRYEWPVSTGKAGYSTPSGTFTPLSMNKVWYSREWDNAPMPHAIFFMKDGHAIHGSFEVKHLGKAVSHGCVRISPQNAATLFSLVKKTGLKNTQVVLAGDTPGGEAKVATSASSRPRHSQSAAASRMRHRGMAARPTRPRYYAESFDTPQRRGGLFRRLFGAR
jgi:lipoprotein-anchoring transpeptidase ErfK/SrfK